MEDIYLVRDEVLNTCIRSTLFAKGRQFQIIERPWLDNRSNISCIPAGKYKAVYLARSSSGTYKNIYWVQGVQGRSGILIHNGNLVIHSKGCLIIGKRRGILGAEPAVLSSKTALSEFVGLMEKKDFFIHIIGDQYLEAA